MTLCPEHQCSLSRAVTLQTSQGEGLGHHSLSLRGEQARQSTVPKEGSQILAPKPTGGQPGQSIGLGRAAEHPLPLWVQAQGGASKER